ncbi:class E sortase [Streptomyces sp. NPDC090021]|uniref:class E sortase n=1 Tax=Streptomyces sp. NPDC090021 TaxID=3365919 RepID=UPI003814D043
MTMTHSEGAAHWAGPPADRQQYPHDLSSDVWYTGVPPQPPGTRYGHEALPSPDSWYPQEPQPSPDTWYTYSPQAYAPPPHFYEWPDPPHPYAPAAHLPLQPDGTWYTEHPPHSPGAWYTAVPLQSDGTWYGHEPLPLPYPYPDTWEVGQEQAYASAPHLGEWPAGSGENDGLGPPLPSVSAQEPEAMPPEAEQAPASRRAGARRAAASRAASGRRRTARGRAGSGRRRRQPPSTVAARAASTVMVTSGLAMVLFVVNQVLWSNVQARTEADEARARLERAWSQGAAESRAGGEDAGFAPGEGFAIIRIPKLDLEFPIAEGIGTQQVLDKGLVGHYPGTGMPADATGNFVLAAHRNTHGEPFREIGRLVPGDRIVVETSSASYTYEVSGRIPETPPTDVSVLRPVPGGSPFTVSGRYITLTTCTPEFSTRGRLIVFGKLVEEQPRAQV